jgi:hypothetical protein
MPEIIGIACVYGVAICYSDLECVIGDTDPMKYLTSKGLSVHTHPDWDDMVILGTTVVSLDVDPSLKGSTMAPVITIPDILDFSEYTHERPMYYQVPIMQI